MAAMSVIEMDILPAEEGSMGKVRIVNEGIGEIKNNKLIVREEKIVEIDFTQSNHRNQQDCNSFQERRGISKIKKLQYYLEQ